MPTDAVGFFRELRVLAVTAAEVPEAAANPTRRTSETTKRLVSDEAVMGDRVAHLRELVIEARRIK
jgi:hypothetical protein